MILCVDIGNTNIKLEIKEDKIYTIDEYKDIFKYKRQTYFEQKMNQTDFNNV